MTVAINWFMYSEYHRLSSTTDTLSYTDNKFYKGAFKTTWSEFWKVFTPMDSLYTLRVDKNRYFLTPSSPHFVHIVIEWPLREFKKFKSLGWT